MNIYRQVVHSSNNDNNNKCKLVTKRNFVLSDA